MSRHPKYGPRCSEFNNTSTCKLLNRCSPGFVTLRREGTPENASWRIKRVTYCSGITSCFLERMFVCVPLAPRPVARVSQRLRFQRHSERLSGWQPGRETSSGALRARMCACVCDFFFGFFFIWWVKLGAGSVWQQISVSALWTHKKKSKSNRSVEYKMPFFHRSDEKQRWFNICCSFSLSLLLNCS